MVLLLKQDDIVERKKWMMAKIISLFNYKGGVSKTTTTFHLGWKLAEQGYKTLIVDSDPQCNLTGLCINADKENKLIRFYESNTTNLHSSLSPALVGRPEPLQAATCYEFQENSNLYLLPGHIDFAEFDATYSVAETLTGSLLLFQNVPGALRHLLLLTAQQYGLDYILVDMSPSISATNANILMESDFFILPCAPDYFCYMAIESLAKVFPRWSATYQKLKENDIFKNASYKLNESVPRFIGTIQQKYRPRNGSPAKAFSEWIEDINNLVKRKLVPVLTEHNMVIPYKPENYEDVYNLANIADFNSLIAQSQMNNTPVYLLTKEQVQQNGSVWENMKENRDKFNETFEMLASRVVCATE
jgi:cellulose biosynthesis protein BcsQ